MGNKTDGYGSMAHNPTNMHTELWWPLWFLCASWMLCCVEGTSRIVDVHPSRWKAEVMAPGSSEGLEGRHVAGPCASDLLMSDLALEWSMGGTGTHGAWLPAKVCLSCGQGLKCWSTVLRITNAFPGAALWDFWRHSPILSNILGHLAVTPELLSFPGSVCAT